MSTMLDTIYKRDSSGNIRVWTAEVEDNKWRTTAGIMGGKLVTSEWTVCTPKSQDTAEEQAMFEAKAEHQKKLDRDYRATIADVDVKRASIIKPMLAHKYEGWIGPGYVQPKLDGIRCIATKDGLWSRQGKPILGVPHIQEALSPLFDDVPDLIFDGELYNHDLHDDFNTITSVVKKQKPTADDLAKSRDLIQYHVYDLPSQDGSFHARWVALTAMHFEGPLKLVDTKFVDSEESLLAEYAYYVKIGYEGQMFRQDGDYEQKRSKNLLKHKSFKDAEFPISRIIEGIGNWAGYAKAVEFILPNDLRLENGERPKAGIKGTREFCRDLLTSQAPENTKIKFFDYTPAGIPRFPIAIDFFNGERL